MGSVNNSPRSASWDNQRVRSPDLGNNENDNVSGWDSQDDAAPGASIRGRALGQAKRDASEVDDESQESGPGYSNDENRGEEHDRLFLARPAHRRDSDGSLSSPPGSAYSPDQGDSDASSVAKKSRRPREEALRTHGGQDEAARRSLQRRSPLKRSRSEAAHSQDPGDVLRPFKRARGAINHQYVALLNADIEDACDRHVPYPWPELPPSQFGLTFWTPEEKHFFFEALARLGRHRPDLIAARLETKTEMEVRQYLDLLERAKCERRKGGQLDPIQKHQVPAAVEIGQECAAALEQAGDALSLLQEAHEEATARSRQRKDGHLLLTVDNCRELVSEAKIDAEAQHTHHLDPLVFFNPQNWLELSERVFMNASFEEMNWQSVSHEPPSIRLVALADFYAIVRAVTRKLVCEAVFNARACSRGRSRTTAPKGHLTVHARHVPSPEQVVGKAEVAGRELFFASCARRLHLTVVDDQDDETQREDDDDDGPEFMSYEDVESALSDKLREKHRASAVRTDSSHRDASPVSLNNEPSDGSEDFNENGMDNNTSPTQGPATAGGKEATEVPGGDYGSDWESISTIDLVESDGDMEEEVDEVLVYSAFGLAGTTKDKNALRLRIRAEREREELAEAVDCRNSYVEERRLWAEVLGRSPTVPPERVPKPELKPGSAAVAIRRKLTVDDLVQ